MLSIVNCVIRDSEKQAEVLAKVVRDFRWDHDRDDEVGDREDYYDYYYSSEFDGYGDCINGLGVLWGELHVGLEQAEWELER